MNLVALLKQWPFCQVMSQSEKSMNVDVCNVEVYGYCFKMCVHKDEKKCMIGRLNVYVIERLQQF